MNETPIEHSEVGLRELLQLRGHYWQSRQWSLLRRGLPAVIITLLVLIPALLSPLTRRMSVERYRNSVNEAVRRNEFEAANLFLNKLDSLPSTDPEDEKLRFNRALVDLARGETERVETAMMNLAPADRIGYGPAHLWLIRKLIAEDPLIAGRNSELILHHLNAYLTTDRKNTEIHLMLGNYHFRTGNQLLAIEHLRQAVDTRPEMHFVLANLYEQTGDAALAAEHFEQAIPVIASTLKQNPGNEDQRVSLALANYKLGKFDVAEQTLLAGMDPASPSPRLAETLSAFYLKESDRLRIDADPGDPEFAASMMLLSKALQYGPSNEAAINRIALVAGFEGEVGEQAYATLKKMLLAGKVTPLVHLILGTNALYNGNLEDARLHLKQAYRQDPTMPVVLNNVAWMLANQDNPRLEPALQLVNRAIGDTPATDPLYPHMVETRGQIYAMQGKWAEAVSDLEIALKSMPKSYEVHGSLEKAYRALGDSELADEHGKLALEYKPRESP